ncbi:MAG TPA: Uma2 family endonuclease [Ktedonobacteraceae bacterium]|nr:Uma2 family endonuclease [Ktedonobacteraceae bacterium]
MAIKPYRTKVSVEEYLAIDRESLDVRYEYIDGTMYMLAGGTANHAVIYPDVSVSCDARDIGTTDIIEHLRLVVEVLSPSTRDYDRGTDTPCHKWTGVLPSPRWLATCSCETSSSGHLSRSVHGECSPSVSECPSVPAK